MQERSLEVQRDEYKRRRFLAMPLAGTIMWFAVGMASLFLEGYQLVLMTYICVGSIAYLGMFLSKLTGEDFLDKSKPKNEFDTLFMMTVMMSFLVFSIAIPFGLQDPQSIPFSLGILTGLMWLPLSWTIKHPIGILHAVGRTVALLLIWFLFPNETYTLIPFTIVGIYLVVIFVLERRWKQFQVNEIP
ncbi:hypothetical protein QGN29_05725 [Temperatibacter marinus]|uniref:Uncharacterized protein n=1 Tax=Temperatibacter marinus TaxID=1456591 RepID=A0AA52EKF6_9PROT|nr:hypothetical protein [Temperatibacter marinus]WND03869.1 hypothetical protein QGN29_05725 [Temperatibacter marinus]